MEKIVFDDNQEFAIKFFPFNREESFEDVYWLNFEIVEIVTHYNYIDNSPMFGGYDKGFGKECLDFDVAYKEHPLGNGFIKWDGCMEIHNLNYHFCGMSDILQRIVNKIYQEASKLIGKNFDRDLANFP